MTGESKIIMRRTFAEFVEQLNSCRKPRHNIPSKVSEMELTDFTDYNENEQGRMIQWFLSGLIICFCCVWRSLPCMYDNKNIT